MEHIILSKTESNKYKLESVQHKPERGQSTWRDDGEVGQSAQAQANRPALVPGRALPCRARSFLCFFLFFVIFMIGSVLGMPLPHTCFLLSFIHNMVETRHIQNNKENNHHLPN